MKKDILIVNCPPWDTKSPPLTLGYLESYIESQGYNVSVIDFNIELFQTNRGHEYLWEMNLKNYWRDPDEFHKIVRTFTKEIDEVVDRIVHNPVQIVAFAVSDPRQAMSMTLIKKIKKKAPEKKIVVGGPYYVGSGTIGKMEKELIDLIVIGEGEETITKIIKSVKEDKPLDNIPGTKVFVNGEEKINEVEVKEHSLRDYPFPKYKNFDMSLYETRSITCEWSRGCIGKCTFCQNIVQAKKYRFRKAENIFEEIKYNVKYNKIEHITLADPSMNGNLRQLNRLCDLIIDSGIKIKWSGLAIPREDMSLELLKKMKKAGCNRLEYGIESGSKKVLGIMKKYHSIEGSEKVLEQTKKAKIQSVIFIMVGYPGETEKDFQETLDFLSRNKDNIDLVRSVNAPYLMEGTDLMSKSKEYGIVIPDGPKRDYKWYTEKGNTAELRDKRVEKTIKHLKKLGIPNELHSLNENKDLKFKERHKKKIITRIKPSFLKKRTDILLVNPPPWGVEDPPIGIAYIATYMQKKGIKVSCYDMNIKIYNSCPQELKHLWHVENKNFWKNKETFEKLLKIMHKQIEKAVQDIIRYEAPIIAFNVVDPKERITIELIKKIKDISPETKIILGGPGTGSEDARGWYIGSIPELIEGYVVGEGEQTLYETTKALLDDKPIDDIPGIMTYKKGKYNDFKPRKLLPIFRDDLWPTYKEFDLKEYDSDVLRVEWSRGCISNCVFCKGKALNPGYRFRDPKNIVNELEYHSKKNGIKKFIIVDLTVNGNLKKLEKVCDRIIERDLEVEWLAEGIPRGDMSYSLFRKMRKAGCYEFQMGVESGSDKVLKKMKKLHSAKEAERAVRNASRAGIRLGLFILVGFPNEDEKDFKKTLDFIRRNKKYISYIKSINAVHLIDDTDLMENPKKYDINTPLPKDGSHYKWITKKGNDWKTRQKRMRKMYSLLKELDLPLIETNYHEGKENQDNRDLDDITKKINELQDLKEFTNFGLTREEKGAIRLFFECLKEHGVSYTFNHTMLYIKDKISK